MSKSKDHDCSHGGGGAGGESKGSPIKRTKLSFGQKPSVGSAGFKLQDSTSNVVTILPVPPSENGSMLYKGMSGFSAVAITKVAPRQRKKLPTWPMLDSDDESDFELSEDDDDEDDDDEDEDWDGEGAGGGGSSRDDVVHCVCGSEVDEGFMIQVRGT